MAHKTLWKHSLAVRLPDLFSHYKDLQTFEKDREEILEPKAERGRNNLFFLVGV